MNCCYAIIPDKGAQPAAVFECLEDAMDWGVQRYGNDGFRIRTLSVARIERAEQHGARGPV
jgi:hypothetical protein